MGEGCSMDPQDGNLAGRPQINFGKYQMTGDHCSSSFIRDLTPDLHVFNKVSRGDCKLDSIKLSSGSQHLDNSR